MHSSDTNVLMVARVLDTGGIERDVSKFARYLPLKGFQPHVACFHPGGARWREIELAGIPTVAFPVKSFRSWSLLTAIDQFRQYVKKYEIRLIHAFDVPADMFTVPISRFLALPVLSSQLCYRDLCSPSARAVMAIIDRLATGTFVNCEGIAHHLEKDWKVTPGSIHLCYNGYEPNEFHARQRQRPDSVADASVVIGTIALLRPEKNLNILIDAFAKILQIEEKARLLVVGSGPCQEALEEKARNLKIRHACVFQSAVDQPAKWMRGIDIFVLPSKSEGFSNSLLEAMACGCCPVGSRIGGTPELITHNARGLLFESGNLEQLIESLTYLVKNPETMQRLGANAAGFARAHLTMEHAVSRLAGIYNTLLGLPIERGGGRPFVSLRQQQRTSYGDFNEAYTDQLEAHNG
jgi:glycosyltransferase involved in cell wall biosynthesis